MNDDIILQAVARGWCSPENSHKVMDPDLAKAIAREIRAILPSNQIMPVKPTNETT